MNFMRVGLEIMVWGLATMMIWLSLKKRVVDRPWKFGLVVALAGAAVIAIGMFWAQDIGVALLGGSILALGAGKLFELAGPEKIKIVKGTAWFLTALGLLGFVIGLIVHFTLGI
jgi:hypothetical protein